MMRVESIKKYRDSEWERIASRHRHHSGGGYVSGREIMQEHTRLADTIIRRLVRSCVEDDILQKNVPLTMVALGGYGREELNPHSDIDLLILYDCPRPEIEGTAKRVVTDLWDVGFDVGNVARTIPECRQAAAEDGESRTAMLEARYIMGDQELYKQFEREIKTRAMRKGANRYILNRIEDWRQDLGNPERTLYVQEPHIKEGVGGLREAHISKWISRVRFGLWEIPALAHSGILPKIAVDDYESALDFLWRVRNELHYIAKRRSDVLSFQFQERVAKALGYEDSRRKLAEERLMQDYFLHARWIHECAQMVILQSRREPTWISRKMDKVSSKPLAPGLIVLRERIRFEQGALEEALKTGDAALLVMEMFYRRAEMDTPISVASRKQIVETLHRVGPKFGACLRTQNRFLELLALPNGVGDALRDMHNLGVLTAMAPEFEGLRSLVRYDHYHKFTTDVHTLAAVSNLDDRVVETAQKNGELLPVLSALNPDERVSLRLGMLLHDIGKGAPGDMGHVERGMPLANRALGRLRPLRDAQRNDVMFLVEKHHLKSNTAQRRNLDDPAVIERYTEEIGSLKRARMLYLLTYGDIRAVDPDLWTDWSATLLHKLYAQTERCLRGEALVSPGQLAALAEASVERLGEEWKERVHEHFRLMSGGRMPFYSIREIAEQTLAVDEFARGASCALRIFSESEAYSTAIFAAKDRIGMFADLAAALTATGVEVLSADLNSRSDGPAVDTLHFSGGETEGLKDQIVEAFEQAQRGELDIKEHIQELRQRDSQKHRTAHTPPEARFNNDDSADYTIIDVQSAKRVGLLYTIAKTLSDANLNISLAKISTAAYRSVCVFYVADETGAKVQDSERIEAAVNALHQALESGD